MNKQKRITKAGHELKKAILLAAIKVIEAHNSNSDRMTDANYWKVGHLVRGPEGYEQWIETMTRCSFKLAVYTTNGNVVFEPID